MIAQEQRARILGRIVRRLMQLGRVPRVQEIQDRVLREVEGKQLGAPLTRFRPAIPGYPIGGSDGKDIERTFSELREDLELLYDRIVFLARRSTDVYDIFAARRDRIARELLQIRGELLSALTHLGAGRRDSVSESFHNLDQIDLDRTTVSIDLDEGSATLPPDSQHSIPYDGSRVKVVRAEIPAGSEQPGPPIEVVFSPYRLDAWYARIPTSGEVVIVANVTGANYEGGDTEEVEINGIRIDPTTAMQVRIDWSPDGFNWHKPSPEAAATIRTARTFYFDPVRLGYVRIRIGPPNELTDDLSDSSDGRTAVGIKRIEFFRRGFGLSAVLYSREYTFNEPVQTVSVQLDSDLPPGTQIVPYVSQGPDGPWFPAEGQPVKFDSVDWVPVGGYFVLNSLAAEIPDSPHSFYYWPVDSVPLPNSGELVAGRDQVRIEAYSFDWSVQKDREHIPQLSDWNPPLGVVRAGLFSPVGNLGSPDEVGSTTFRDDRNPVAIDHTESGGSYLVLAIVQGDGKMVLQPGFNYRLTAYVFCPTATTLAGQRIGVINTGGSAGTVIAPVSLYINGKNVYQQDRSVTAVSGLTASWQTSIGFDQGWNEVTLLVQIPKNIVPGQDGVGGSSVYLYVQPNLFAPDRARALGIHELRAYRDPWRRVSEFDLRFNVPVGVKEVWAWKGEQAGIVTAVLLNHDPSNSLDSPQGTTIDGVLAGGQTALHLRYPTERVGSELSRSLYFKADFLRDPDAKAPPVLYEYRLLVN